MKTIIISTIALFFVFSTAQAQTNTFPASGNVGVGTTTPTALFHIKKGDTPIIKLEQDNSSGWTAQTWDIAGNEANFFVRDVTGGALLPFRIQPGTPTSTLSLKTPGYVGINTWTPTVQMDVRGLIRVSKDLTIPADSGMIKYQNGDFWGHDGIQWLSFTNLDMYSQIQLLEDRIDSLEARIDSCCITTKVNNNFQTETAQLYQNNPNPYSTQTQIGFYIPASALVAAIYIYDLSGKQLMKIQINDRKNGSISIAAGQLQAGMYFYSLIIDGKFIDSKRMIITD